MAREELMTRERDLRQREEQLARRVREVERRERTVEERELELARKERAVRSRELLVAEKEKKQKGIYMCMHMYTHLCIFLCMRYVHEKRLMMVPDKPAIPGQWLFRAC